MVVKQEQRELAAAAATTGGDAASTATAVPQAASLSVPNETPAPAMPTPAAAPVVVASPAVPAEPEDVRRKRKLNEMIGDMAPWMHTEVGVTDVSRATRAGAAKN